MVQLRRPGRPKGPLPPSDSLLTTRVRLLIDRAHLGNLREVATHTGLPYGTIRDLYLGRSVRPSAETLRSLALGYGLTIDWFLDRSTEEQPDVALTATLPPDPEFRRGREGRQFSIPLAAWPLARLVLRLEMVLGHRPATATRPLIGALREPVAIRQQIVVFLLGPLLEAQRLGLVNVLGADPPYPGTQRATETEQAAWIATLRRLGEYWELALEPMIVERERRG